MLYDFLIEGHGESADLIVNELLYYCDLFGNEDLSWEQLNEKFVLARYDNFTKFSVLSILFLRTPASINLILASDYNHSDSAKFYDLARQVKWPDYFSSKKSFAVRTKSPQLDKILVGKSVGQAIVDVFMSEIGSKPKVNLRNPDVEVFVYLIDERIFIALPLTKQKFNKPEIASIHGLLAWLFHEKYLKDKICCYTKVDCKEIKNFLMRQPLVDRILDMPILDVPILDQQLTLKLISRFKECKQKLVHNIVEYSQGSCPLVIANLFNYDLSKIKQKLVLEELMENKNIEILGLVAREDIFSNQKNNNFKVQKLAKLHIDGIPASIVVMSR